MHIKQERRCTVCRENKQQSEMLRVAKIDASFTLDYKQKLGGRGAYICKTKQCLVLAKKKKALNRAFKCSVPEQIYVELEKYEQSI